MVLTDPRQIDAAWINDALSRAGAIDQGRVAAIRKEPFRRHAWSRMVRISVRYARGSSGLLPRRLLVKLCGAEGGVFGPSEVDYYRCDYRGARDAPLPRCFDASYADQPRRYHLLLEDLSGTHCTGDDIVPGEAYAFALAESLAALHAHRWGAARMQEIRQALPGPGDIERYVAHVRPGLEPMLELARELAAPWPSRLRRLFDELSDSFATRAQDPRGMTIVHGDLNPGNILIPVSGAGPVLFVDRQPFDWSLTRWLGASDLVYAVVPWWDTPVRRRLEEAMLSRYHAALAAHGITDYPVSMLQADYRLCAAMAIAVPVEWCVLESDRERMRWLWTRQLERGLAALDDLGW